MPMTRAEQDAFDRRMAGIMDPNDPMADTQRGMAGGPIASYSMSDIRRLLGFGPRPAMSPAEAADAAQMYERVPNDRLPPTPPGGYDAPSPSIPYMPSTDPRGAAAPIPAPPLPVSPRGGMPARPAAPRLPVMRGLPTNEASFRPQAVPPGGEMMNPLAPPMMNAPAAAVDEAAMGVLQSPMPAGTNAMNRSLEDRRRFPMNDTTYLLRDPSRVYTYDELEEARRGDGTGTQRLNREQLVRALNTYGYNQLNPVQPFRRTGLFRPQQ